MPSGEAWKLSCQLGCRTRVTDKLCFKNGRVYAPVKLKGNEGIIIA
jgi:hypothetical protein